jgi:hypothetical protein
MSKPTDAKQTKEGGGGSSFLAELRGSAANAGETAAAGTKSRRISSTYYLAAVMTVMSGGALFGMRTYGKNAGGSVQKFDAEFKPVKSEAVTAAQTQRVLAELEAHKSPIQISKDAIRRNPFVLGAATPTPIVDDKGRVNLEMEKRARDAAERERLAKEQELKDTLGNLEVTGVMMGSRPVARVSGKLYRVGDVIAKMFTVAEITDRGVKLTSDGKEFEISIKKDLNPDGTKPENDPSGRR